MNFVGAQIDFKKYKKPRWSGAMEMVLNKPSKSLYQIGQLYPGHRRERSMGVKAGLWQAMFTQLAGSKQ